MSFESIKALCGIKNFSVIYAKSPTKEHYLISLWHQNTLNALFYALKTHNYRLSDLVKNTSSVAINFDQEEEFLNLNTLKDYELAVQILKRGPMAEEEKTELPSAKKIQKAREEGNVPKSMEVVGVLGLLAGLIGILFFHMVGGWL